MLKHLEGKFFWEPSSHPGDPDAGSPELRRAQRAIAGKVKIISTKIAPDVVETETIKPMRRALKGEAKVLEPLIMAISKVYKIAPDDVVRRTTSPKFATAKHHLYWGIFRYTTCSTFSEAGRLLGKCHTTIMHGVTMFHRNIDEQKVVDVERELGLV